MIDGEMFLIRVGDTILVYIPGEAAPEVTRVCYQPGSLRSKLAWSVECEPIVVKDKTAAEKAMKLLLSDGWRTTLEDLELSQP